MKINTYCGKCESLRRNNLKRFFKKMEGEVSNGINIVMTCILWLGSLLAFGIFFTVMLFSPSLINGCLLVVSGMWVLISAILYSRAFKKSGGVKE